MPLQPLPGFRKVHRMRGDLAPPWAIIAHPCRGFSYRRLLILGRYFTTISRLLGAPALMLRGL